VYVKSWDENDGAQGSVQITKPSDLSGLTGAPEEFIDFLGRELADAAQKAEAFTDCDGSGFSVHGIDSEIGVATGDEWECQSGGSVLWIRWKGRWVLGQTSQEGWNCSTLEQYRVPAAIAAPTCDASSGQGDGTREIRYEGPEPLPTDAGTPGRKIVYMSTLDANSHGTDGRLIGVEDDPAPLLKGAPSVFIDAIDEQRGEGCDLMVDGVDPSAGVATGSATGCRNERAIIWILWNRTWIEATSNPGRWPCDDLKRFRVPADLAGSTCSEWSREGEESVVGYEPSSG